MPGGLDALGRRLAKIEGEVLSGKASKDTATAVGMMAKDQVAGLNSLGGDNAFSGWKRGQPIQLTAAFSLHKSNDGGVTIHRGRKAGIWRVAEEGRNQGNAGGFAGPGISKDGTTKRNKNGSVRKVRERKAKRWNGTTKGFGVWSAYEREVLSHVSETVAKETRAKLTRAVLG